MQALRYQCCGGPAGLMCNDDKLVAPQPGKGLVMTQGGAKTACKLGQDQITAGMPLGIVDFLEAVEIHKHQR
ncbi:hypothetical protein SDC9_212937 [bioreactor metagenome]|uniref:Uncharacterized protein n=1 Tax=bioreactor metagenome TaxID=1076179 RepID=A0A645JNB7_9ZZZZ